MGGVRSVDVRPDLRLIVLVLGRRTNVAGDELRQGAEFSIRGPTFTLARPAAMLDAERVDVRRVRRRGEVARPAVRAAPKADRAHQDVVALSTAADTRSSTSRARRKWASPIFAPSSSAHVH